MNVHPCIPRFDFGLVNFGGIITVDQRQMNVELIATLAERLGEHLIAGYLRERFRESAPTRGFADDPALESPQEAVRRRQREGKINRLTGLLNYHKIVYAQAPPVPDFATLRATPEGRTRYNKALEERLKALEELYYSIELAEHARL